MDAKQMAVLDRAQAIDSDGAKRASKARAFAAVLTCVLLVAVSVQAQERTSEGSAPQSEPPAVEAPDPANRPGFLDALGRWLGGSKDAIDSSLKSTQDTLGTLGSQATGAARDAAGSVVAIPGTRIVTGRQVCPVASNGAPDCQRGVEALCKGNGFQGGKVLDIMSGQRCSAKNWIAGGMKREAVCRTETYVTRGVCQ